MLRVLICRVSAEQFIEVSINFHFSDVGQRSLLVVFFYASYQAIYWKVLFSLHKMYQAFCKGLLALPFSGGSGFVMWNNTDSRKIGNITIVTLFTLN